MTREEVIESLENIKIAIDKAIEALKEPEQKKRTLGRY